MLRNSRYKYIYYVNDPPQLFDLVTDPQESHDLAASPAHQEVLQAFEAQLRVMLDPEAVDAQAKASQRAKVAAFGGEAAVRRRGSFSNSPVPGEAPAFSRFD
jgi:choline-sulfatase